MRCKAAVLVSADRVTDSNLAEVDPCNYAPHVKTPEQGLLGFTPLRPDFGELSHYSVPGANPN